MRLHTELLCKDPGFESGFITKHYNKHYIFPSNLIGLVVSVSTSHAVGGLRCGWFIPETIIKMVQTAPLLGTQALG